MARKSDRVVELEHELQVLMCTCICMYTAREKGGMYGAMIQNESNSRVGKKKMVYFKGMWPYM